MAGLMICMFVVIRDHIYQNTIVEDTINKRPRQNLGEHSRASLAAIAAKRIQNTQSRRRNRAQHRKHQQRLSMRLFEHASSSDGPGTPLEGPSSSSKAASRFGKNWALSLLQETNTRGLEFQKMVVEAYWVVLRCNMSCQIMF